MFDCDSQSCIQFSTAKLSHTSLSCMLDGFNQRGKGDQGREVEHVRPGVRNAEHVRLARQLLADERLDHHGGVGGG